MASIIKIKRSEVSGNPAVLGAGELAYSALPDNGSNGGDRLYIGMGTETSGNAVNHVVIGGKYFTDMISAATNANTASTLVKRDASGNFTAGTITAALSGNASTATKWATARNLSLTGDATATLTAVDGTSAVSAALTLATVNSNVGTYGSTTSIPIVTVNEKGLVTAVSSASISTSLSIAASTGTGSLALGTDTFTVAGGTGVSTELNGKTITVAIGQDVSQTANPTFNNTTVNNLTVNGELYSDDIHATNLDISNNLNVNGNLVVRGTTTTINSTDLSISDKNIILAKDATSVSETDGAGITVAGMNSATFTYDLATNSWTSNKNITAGIFTGGLQGNAATATKLANYRLINGVSFDGTSNITITASTTNTLTFGSGLSGGSFNGSSAVTLAVDSTIARRADTHYIGTTAVTLDRASANLALTGISSVTLPGATSGSVQIIPAAVAGTGTVLTLPATTGTLITSGDTGTVSNAMLAGSIPNSKLANSSVTIGSTVFALGTSSTTLTGLTSVSSTSFVGALTGNADTASNATKLATSRSIAATGDATWTVNFDGSANATAALTLATVNSNIGTFGNATTVPTVTVNAKGLVTAVTTTAIPTATTSVNGLASFSSLNFSVTSGAVSISGIDGGTY